MGADLHIHVFEGIDIEDLKEFFANTLGSKYFNLRRGQGEAWSEAYKKIAKTPNIWIGEASWLKASLCKDEKTADKYVPATVERVCEIIGEDLPILDDILIQKILDALDLPNDTAYNVTTKKDEVEKFLLTHKGKKVFTVSW